MDLFFADRLAEDERLARDLIGRRAARNVPGLVSLCDRTLRMVDADRQLLAAYNSAFGGGGPDFDSGYARGLEDAIRYRLLEWSDHSDYSQDWRP
jgi:Family of unknown function (DUF6221)